MYKHLFSCSKNEKFIRKILEWQETLDDYSDDDDVVVDEMVDDTKK